MKTLRKILKLLPPAFAMRIWLARKYGIKVKPSPWGGIVGLALEIMPYAFTAALSVRVDSDSRLLKYFLPYGRMKKFVGLAYGMRVGNDKVDQGLVGAIRFVMPYGLVLWWDAEDARLSRKVNNPPKTMKSYRQTACTSCITAEMRREDVSRLDRLEALMLRLMILSGED